MFNKFGLYWGKIIFIFKKGDMWQHIQSIHENVKYQCPQCDYKATLKSSLTKHIKSIHERVEYNWPQCNYKSNDKTTIRRHIQSIHENVKYQCPQCNHRAGHIVYICCLLLSILITN